MSELVRLYQYKGLLSGKKAWSVEDLMAKLEVSRATVKRDITKLRDQLRLPVRFERDRGGYVLEAGHTDSELPGLWFSPDEILALATVQQMLAQLAPGVLGTRLQPLQDRLSELVAKQGLSSDGLRRIRIEHASGKRHLDPQSFEAVAAGTLGRRKLRVTHFHRERGESVDRELSPQRLVHYRDNWYLDAWCHLRKASRSFAVDALSNVIVLAEACREVNNQDLDQELGGSYGIFAGEARHWATLRFSAARSRWVRGETWHPDQTSRELPGGGLEISIPYSDDRELMGDVLRFGADVQVVAPSELRKKVQQAALEMVSLYVH